MSEKIEAVFENGVFRPLQPVDFPEQWRVTLQVPECDQPDKDSSPVTPPAVQSADGELDDELVFEPLPPDNVKTIPVKFRFIGKIGPIPFDLNEEAHRVLDELDE